jgi:hypothetical protein
MCRSRGFVPVAAAAHASDPTCPVLVKVFLDSDILINYIIFLHYVYGFQFPSSPKLVTCHLTEMSTDRKGIKMPKLNN